MGRRSNDGWPRYIPVAEKKQKAAKKITKLRKSGAELCPVEIEGRTIAHTFWGKGWCRHLESFSDYSNRLPRGRSYVRNGLVCHLAIGECRIEAMVSGSRLYNVEIKVSKLPKNKWTQLKKLCAGRIGSLVELLQGKLSDNIMTVITDRQNGLFPLPGEIEFDCDCPDWADMCKHVAAALYGSGRRLDENPELLFVLRGVNQDELIAEGTEEALICGVTEREGRAGKRRRVADDRIEDVFGIELNIETTGVRGGNESGLEVDKSAVENLEGGAFSINHAGLSAVGNDSCKPSFRDAAPQDICAGVITGQTVAALRKALGMSQKDFALLLKVSAASIYHWEKREGPLKLQDRNRRALLKAASLKPPRGAHN